MYLILVALSYSEFLTCLVLNSITILQSPDFDIQVTFDSFLSVALMTNTYRNPIESILQSVSCIVFLPCLLVAPVQTSLALISDVLPPDVFCSLLRTAPRLVFLKHSSALLPVEWKMKWELRIS